MHHITQPLSYRNVVLHKPIRIIIDGYKLVNESSQIICKYGSSVSIPLASNGELASLSRFLVCSIHFSKKVILRPNVCYDDFGFGWWYPTDSRQLIEGRPLVRIPLVLQSLDTIKRATLWRAAAV